VSWKQKVCLLIGVAAIAFMGAFPPWLLRVDCVGGKNQSNGGYHWILTPPEIPKRYYKDGMTVWYSTVDISRLGIQWAVGAVITGGLVAILAGKRTDKQKDKPGE